MRVDCSYLVTAWSATNNEEQVSTEHQLLGVALRELKVRTCTERVETGSLRQ